MQKGDLFLENGSSFFCFLAGDPLFFLAKR